MPTPRRTIKTSTPPEGFLYCEESITAAEEGELVRHIEQLPLKEFQFHGYEARRRTLSFGWHYDFGQESLDMAAELPEFLLPLREFAAEFAGLQAGDFPHVLITEYMPGTPIGW